MSMHLKAFHCHPLVIYWSPFPVLLTFPWYKPSLETDLWNLIRFQTADNTLDYHLIYYLFGLSFNMYGDIAGLETM